MSTDCILTLYPLTSDGYGQMWVNGKRVKHHRVAYCLANGLLLSDIAGKSVLHSCDNRACVNPAHLRLGNAWENAQDMTNRGRADGFNRKGAAHPMSKLSIADIVAIRTARATQKQLALQYGISQSQISRIQRGENWK